MSISIEAADARMPGPSLTDCGLCTHPAHSTRECSAVNEFGQCVCWWYMPAAVYEARCAA
jgi:hypothetical protein